MDSIRTSIAEGDIKPGTLLPPTRELAIQLSVSRDTVVKAYAELVRLSLVHVLSTRGYAVSDHERTETKNTGTKTAPFAEERISRYGRDLLSSKKNYPVAADFSALNYGGPPLQLLPIRKWKEQMQAHAAGLATLNHTPEVLGREELRRAIATFLLRFKHIQVKTTEVIVFNSTFAATNLLCRLLLNPGESIAVEEPGFGGVRNIAQTLGLKVVPIPVDEHGISVDSLSSQTEDIRLVYVTPNHQEPTGCRLALARRTALIDWARHKNAWIIEDDFNGFFNYGNANFPALRALDQRVIYLATFWKLLYPLTSIGFCVVPQALLSLIATTKVETEGISETITQLSLATLIDAGYLEKHIRRLRTIYRNRRQRLIYCLKSAFGKDIEITGEAGTECYIRLAIASQDDVLDAALKARLPLISSDAHYLQKPESSAFLVDFSVLEEDEILVKVNAFSKALKESR